MKYQELHIQMNFKKIKQHINCFYIIKQISFDLLSSIEWLEK